MSSETADKIRIQPVGDSAIMIELGNQIDLATNLKVHQLADYLAKHRMDGSNEVVPAYASLMVHYDSLIVDYRKVRDWVVESLQRIQANPVRNQRQIDIPTIYGGEFGIDLDFVADYHKMSVNEIVYLHSEAIYTVYMMGFTPGFAYLGGLPEDLATPRLENPRTLVKAGSIGIAGNQTGIYPIDSPGGWRIIGYTSIRLFNPFLDSPTLLTPGDQVRFVPVSSPG